MGMIFSFNNGNPSLSQFGLTGTNYCGPGYTGGEFVTENEPGNNTVAPTNVLDGACKTHDEATWAARGQPNQAVLQTAADLKLIGDTALALASGQISSPLELTQAGSVIGYFAGPGMALDVANAAKAVMQQIAALGANNPGFGHVQALSWDDLQAQSHNIFDKETAGQTWIHPASSPTTYRIVYIDPLAIDLNNDGHVETVAANGFDGALFDHDGAGIRTATGWVGSNDGFLVRDLNGNGKIDSGTEMFGDTTLLTNGQKAATGFAALADLDGNSDGKVDAADTAFAELRVWRDLNQDGISDSGEVFTLDQVGIASLNTASTATAIAIASAGGMQTLAGSVTHVDGGSALLADLNLTQDTFHSSYTASVTVPAALQDLPNLTGMGRLHDLIEAAALSPTLADVLARFTTAGTRAEQRALLDELLLDWAKTDPRYTEAPVQLMSSMIYDPNSTNIIYLRPGQALPSYLTNTTYADASIDVQHHVRVLDAIRGDRVTNALNVAIPQESLATINANYTALADAVYDALLPQTRLRPYLDMIALAFDENGLRFDFSAMQQLFATHYATDPAGTLADLLDLNKIEGKTLRHLDRQEYPMLLRTVVDPTVTERQSYVVPRCRAANVDWRIAA